MNTITLTKNIGAFRLNTPVAEYLDNCGTIVYSPGFNYRGIYELDDFVLYTRYGLIEGIACRSNCYLKGENLNGMSITRFRSLYPGVEWAVEHVYYEDETLQEVYCFPSLGLELWVTEGERIGKVLMTQEKLPEAL